VKPVKLNRQIKVPVNNAQTQNDILLCVAELSSNNSGKFFSLAESLLFFSEHAFSKVLARERCERRLQNSERRMPRAATERDDRKDRRIEQEVTKEAETSIYLLCSLRLLLFNSLCLIGTIAISASSEASWKSASQRWKQSLRIWRRASRRFQFRSAASAAGRATGN
jgi:hypothetical protein